MTWFKLDDKSAFHRKVVAAGNEAWGALCRAGAWSSGELTDGFIPDQVAALIAKKSVWKRLESCGDSGAKGLVERVENGWQIHDFLMWNPSAESVKQRRETTAKRVERFRGNAVGNAVTHSVVTRDCNAVGNDDPVPTRPDPVTDQIPPTPLAGGTLPVEPEAGKGKPAPKPRTPRTVKTVLPPDWAPDAAHYSQALAEGNRGRDWVEREARAMRDWATAKGERCCDWDARFRNWIRKGLDGGPQSARQQALPKVQPARPGHQWKPRTIDDILGETAT